MEPIDLAHGRTKCDCGKSRTSYPHWPPSCRSEAVDQLCCLLGRSYPHREYLADCWLTSLFRKLALEGTEETEAMITLVQNSCPVLQSAGEVPTAKGRRMHRIAASRRSPTTTATAAVTADSIVKSAQYIVW